MNGYKLDLVVKFLEVNNLRNDGQQLSDLKADHQSQAAASLHRYAYIIFFFYMSKYLERRRLFYIAIESKIYIIIWESF